MRPIRDLPIRQKLLVIFMLVAGAALLFSGVGIVVLDSFLFRGFVMRDLSALTHIIGDNSTAALTFEDPRVAAEILGALRVKIHVVNACLYQTNGTLLASYLRPGATSRCLPPLAREELRSTAGGIEVNYPILLQGQVAGTLVLLYDSGELVDRMKIYGVAVVGILLLAGLVAFLLSAGLRSLIADPIAGLAETARDVSETGDYGIRAVKRSRDEIGLLVDAFNHMLAGVQSRDWELQNARNLFQTTLTSIGDAVISTDVEGRIAFANPVAQSLLRRPASGVIGKSIDEVFRIIDESTRQEAESPVRRVLREGRTVGLANHTVLIAGDGTEVPIDDSAAPIRYDGRTLGVVLVFRDITERRRAQQDAGYLGAIVESSDDAIIGKSPAGIIQSWNAGAERLYGYTAAEAIGHPMTELIPPDRQHEESGILERLRGGDRVVHFETVRLRKNGSLIDVSLTISPIFGRDGDVVGISHIGRDITDQKRQAERMRQTQKLESLGILAGGIAHDFNNLLTGIIGNASLATDELAPGAPTQERIRDIVAASEKAAQLARQMLAYSGKGQFVLAKVDLSSEIRQTITLLKTSIPPAVELRLDLQDRLPPIEADPAQMQQLVMNIIINAAEAVPEGTSGNVTVLTRRQEVDDPYIRAQAAVFAGELAPGTHILFEVSDTGSGMDEATKARIFDPFFTTKFTGRGLGLAAALGIVRGHRGAIRVISSPGRGTTFRILFPATDQIAASVGPAYQSVDRPQTAAQGDGLILVIDDEPVVLNVARQALERSGYRVLLAEDGAHGLELFRREADRLRCVVLDLTMPVMSGEETLNRMKALRPNVPVILSSGFNQTQAVRRFEGKGLAGFLQKPYRAAALLETIQAVLSR